MTVIGAVFSVLALAFYSMAGNTTSTVRTLNILAIVCLAVFLIAGAKLGKYPAWGYLVSAAAVLMMAAVGYSLVTEVEVLGYLISGLRTWADVKFWAYFAIAGLIGWLMLLIASFTRLGAE